MKISKKYKPLFKAIRGEHPEIHSIIITGGRDSQKSFATATAICDAAINYNHRILYTRYTLTSAKDSIIPDFKEKLEMLNYQHYAIILNDRVIMRHNQGKIVFKGFRGSSGDQTARLKGLKNFSILVCEELEEYPDQAEWDKVQLSIRSTDVQAMNILVLNPTTKNHWSYDEFFRSKGVEGGFNGIKDNILYIHTTYLDMPREFIAKKNLFKYETAREIHDKIEPMSYDERKAQSHKDIKKWKYYKHVVLGGWMQEAEGLVYEDWSEFKDFPKEYDLRIFGLDFGFSNDPAAFVECVLTKEDVYLKQHIYKTGLLNNTLSELIKTVLPEDEDCYIVADSASPKDIKELNTKYGLYIMPCVKGQGSVMSTVKIMQSKNIFIHHESDDLKDELKHYHTIELVNSKGERVIHIVDSDNHLLDASRYACTRY